MKKKKNNPQIIIKPFLAKEGGRRNNRGGNCFNLRGRGFSAPERSK